MKDSGVVVKTYQMVSLKGEERMSKLLHITSGDIAGDSL
jgi:aspartate-semialdehyde dehydrogenase